MTDTLMGLQAVRKDLAAKAWTLDQVCQDRSLLWQRLGWDRHQVRLWLRSLPDMEVQDGEGDDPRYRIGLDAPPADDLGETIVRVVEALGGRVPLAQLRTKLPPGLVVTDPMIRAAVQAHPGLTLTGPLVQLLR
ncbi:hypothetical protein [uncultured Lamprocystis sp.]|jgi:hypothetical protein|uniref:hypothetical protein n=1 Tax=uncultured Lamprocystis sp. TaxID=543132 RepID=UPI0025F1B355|nr:hypothetical protein [uncultured Lamprocystis sp.]